MAFSCTCNNITVKVKKIVNSVSVDHVWVNPILAEIGVVDIKYLQLSSIEHHTSVHYKCLNCGDDVCRIKGKDVVINPLLKDLRRTNRKYSEAFELYLLNEQDDEEVNDSSLNKILIDKKQKYLDELEFILQQEELFDEQRRTLQEEYHKIKSEFSKLKKQSMEKCQSNHKKMKRVKTWDSLFPIQNQNRTGVFEFDEEMQDYNLNDNQPTKEKISSHADNNINNNDNHLFKFNVRLCKSVPMTHSNVDIDLVKPNFKKYVIQKESPK
ncbi:Uncharacterized protein QTN25_000034 [Entamoeba marina]